MHYMYAQPGKSLPLHMRAMPRCSKAKSRTLINHQVVKACTKRGFVAG